MRALHDWVLASNNAGKLAELATLLAGLGLDLHSQSEFTSEPAPETALTFVENALLKARHASRLSGLPAIADDSGLCVDALDGAPGIFSARYAGPNASDSENLEKLIAALADVPKGHRSAHYYCAVVALKGPADPSPLISTGRWAGEIALSPVGMMGFGYDPIFYIESLDKTAAELAPADKNRLSHRGQALAGLRQALAAAVC